MSFLSPILPHAREEEEDVVAPPLLFLKGLALPPPSNAVL